MKTNIMMVGIAITCLAVFTAQSEIPKRGDRHNIIGKVTLQIIDDSGLPVKSAVVEMMFIYSDTRGGYETVMGETDTNGCFTAEGKSIGTLSYAASKIGCYKTSGQYKFYQGENRSVENNRWLPWNPTVPVVLKPMKNPIPMYAKKVSIEISEQNKPLGFDLEKGDWVAPYGAGLSVDFLFDVSGIYKELLDRHSFMAISFENVGDGIQGVLVPNDGSKFQSIYEAPMQGYATNYVYEKKMSRIGSERINPRAREDKYYVFRIRTKTDSNGKIVSANYGKIYGDIFCDFIDEKRIGIYFTYYLNPMPNDRNLEFDPKKNLFPNERVNQP